VTLQLPPAVLVHVMPAAGAMSSHSQANAASKKQDCLYDLMGTWAGPDRRINEQSPGRAL